jgi:hypothetical protein
VGAGGNRKPAASTRLFRVPEELASQGLRPWKSFQDLEVRRKQPGEGLRGIGGWPVRSTPVAAFQAAADNCATSEVRQRIENRLLTRAAPIRATTVREWSSQLKAREADGQ